MSVKSSISSSTTSNATNSLSFFVERFLTSKINTCELVQVEDVQPEKQTVTIKPLVNRLDSDGKAIAAQPVYNVPYLRVQGGKVALKIDPVKGDIGVAVFCQRDISTVKKTRKAARPASYRSFDKADALYFGGLLNTDPAYIVELMQDGTIKMTGSKLLVDAEAEFLKGVKINGKLASSGIKNNGGIENSSGNISSNGKVFDTHTHTVPQGGQTGAPQ